MIPGFMPPLGNRLVAPAAGGADATLLTAARMTTLGISSTRTGSQLHIPGRAAITGPSDFVEIAANVPAFTSVQAAGLWWTSLLPQQAITERVPTKSNDFTDAAWTKSDAGGLTYNASGGLANYGYTSIVAPAAEYTISRTITLASALRATIWVLTVPATNTGDVYISQNGGTTETLVPKTGFQVLTIANATLADPNLRIRFTTSGDEATHWNVSHQHPATGTPSATPPVRYPLPVDATPGIIGEGGYQRTGLSVNDVHVKILFTIPSATSVFRPIWMAAIDGPNNFGIMYNNVSWTVRYRAAATNYLSDFTPVAGANLIEMQWNSTEMRRRHNLGAWDALTYVAVPTFTRWAFRDAAFNNNPCASPVLAFEDLAGTLFASAGTGFNVSAIAAFEATL